MTEKVIKVMYDYNTWANERLFAGAGQLTTEKRAVSGSASYSSVRDTLMQTM